MKALYFAVLLLSSTAFAADPDAGIDCVSNSRFGHFTVKAQTIAINGQNEASMWDVIATGKEASEEETTTGRAQNINADLAYAPRKYKNHSRFDLSKLINVETFGPFTPSYCSLSMLIPNDALTKASFVAPTIINCDQNGITVTLNCNVIKRSY